MRIAWELGSGEVELILYLVYVGFGVLFVCRTCSFSFLEHGFGSMCKDKKQVTVGESASFLSHPFRQENRD